MADKEIGLPKAWREQADKELRGRDADDLVWHTVEGIDVKPVYTAEDLENLQDGDALPGFPPYQRGVRSTILGKPK